MRVYVVVEQYYEDNDIAGVYDDEVAAGKIAAFYDHRSVYGFDVRTVAEAEQEIAAIATCRHASERDYGSDRLCEDCGTFRRRRAKAYGAHQSRIA